jgi:hypothetical protein
VDSSELNTWLTLAANVGVLIGLILVALQIRQNTAITRAKVINEWYMADMQLELAMMGDNPAASWVKAIYSPDALDALDAAVVDRYYNYGLVQVQRLQRMYELGVADEQWKERAAYLRWHLGSPGGQRWWRHFRGNCSPEFAAMVDEMLADGEFRMNRDALDALRSSS